MGYYVKKWAGTMWMLKMNMKILHREYPEYETCAIARVSIFSLLTDPHIFKFVFALTLTAVWDYIRF